MTSEKTVFPLMSAAKIRSPIFTSTMETVSPDSSSTVSDPAKQEESVVGATVGDAVANDVTQLTAANPFVASAQYGYDVEVVEVGVPEHELEAYATVVVVTTPAVCKSEINYNYLVEKFLPKSPVTAQVVIDVPAPIAEEQVGYTKNWSGGALPDWQRDCCI